MKIHEGIFSSLHLLLKKSITNKPTGAKAEGTLTSCGNQASFSSTLYINTGLCMPKIYIHRRGKHVTACFFDQSSWRCAELRKHGDFLFLFFSFPRCDASSWKRKSNWILEQNSIYTHTAFQPFYLRNIEPNTVLWGCLLYLEGKHRHGRAECCLVSLRLELSCLWKQFSFYFHVVLRRP